MTRNSNPVKSQENHCPLCSEGKTSHYFSDRNREYFLCPVCDLIFVPPIYQLSTEAEKAIYDLHQNEIYDPGYRRFLSRLSEPLIERVGVHQHGLDFGCGPGPALSVMLEEAGHSMSLYDPHFHNKSSALNRSYDFITATEVVEHLSSPKLEFIRLFGMLESGGILGIMTKMVISPEAFSRWHYIQDQTHICFYSRASFEYIAQKYYSDIEFIGKDVILMRKK